MDYKLIYLQTAVQQLYYCDVVYISSLKKSLLCPAILSTQASLNNSDRINP
jgi:hypothetical protein